MCRHYFRHFLECNHIPRLFWYVEPCSDFGSRILRVRFDDECGEIFFDILDEASGETLEDGDCDDVEMLNVPIHGRCPLCVAFEEALMYAFEGDLRGL